MPMTVVVTRNAPGRFRGFLASSMCEVAPGVYIAPRMGTGVRERVWSVLESWWAAYPDSSLVMTWPDRTMPGGQNLRTLGTPVTQLRQHHGVFLARRDLGAEQEEALLAVVEGVVTLGGTEPAAGKTNGEGSDVSSGAAAGEAGGQGGSAASQATGSANRSDNDEDPDAP